MEIVFADSSLRLRKQMMPATNGNQMSKSGNEK
jgi:hypothetical protein